MGHHDHHHSEGAPRARPETREVDTTVVAVIPEFRQAQIRSADGSLYALTDTTPVRWDKVRKGQQVHCTVTLRLPRVVRAEVLA